MHVSPRVVHVVRGWILVAGSTLLATTIAYAGPGSSAGTDCGPGADRAPYLEPAFLGYACRDADCAAHKAGFAWADRNGTTDAASCLEADDPGFAEGCRAFVEEAVTAEQAGFEWARDNGVGQSCRCGGAGPRFEAGCEAFVAGFSR